jgi:hypothetical protein
VDVERLFGRGPNVERILRTLREMIAEERGLPVTDALPRENIRSAAISAERAHDPLAPWMTHSP